MPNGLGGWFKDLEGQALENRCKGGLGMRYVDISL